MLKADNVYTFITHKKMDGRASHHTILCFQRGNYDESVVLYSRETLVRGLEFLVVIPAYTLLPVCAICNEHGQF